MPGISNSQPPASSLQDRAMARAVLVFRLQLSGLNMGKCCALGREGCYKSLDIYLGGQGKRKSTNVALTLQ
jgi:hypothetical protein